MLRTRLWVEIEDDNGEEDLLAFTSNKVVLKYMQGDGVVSRGTNLFSLSLSSFRE